MTAGTTATVMRTITTLAVVSCLSTSILCVVYHQRALDRLSKIEARLEQQGQQRMVASTWTSGGVSRTVTSTRAADETFDQLLKRHKAEVAAAMVEFPKDPPG